MRGPHFTYSDMYITKTFPIREGIKLRVDGQMFNAFNHPNFALPGQSKPACPACPFRPDSERSKARPRHLPGCLVWDWEATPRRA